jgi:hypothetical protein
MGRVRRRLGHGEELSIHRVKLKLAVQIRRISQDGQEFIDLLFSIMRGEPLPLPATLRHGRAVGRPPRPTIDQRLRALEMLLDRGWGKSKEIIELVDEGAARQERLTLIASMSDADRETLKTIFSRTIEARVRAERDGAIPPSSPAPLAGLVEEAPPPPR